MKEDQVIMDKDVMGDEEYRKAMLDYLMMLATPGSKQEEIDQLKKGIEEYEMMNTGDDL